MKVALLLTGFLRTYKENYNLLYDNFILEYDPDIYISTWSKNEQRFGTDLNKINVNEVIDLYGYNLKNIVISNNDITFQDIIYNDRPNDIFKISDRAKEHKDIWIDRLRRQWYLLYKGFNLIEEEKYDIILRTRFDLQLFYINLIKDAFVIPKDMGGWDYSDHLAYGDYNTMKIYLQLFKHINYLYQEHNIDISHAVDMLQFYMENVNNITTTIDNTIKYNIVKL